MAAWRGQLRREKGVAAEERPWTTLPELQWRGMHPLERVKAILDAVVCCSLTPEQLSLGLCEKRELLKHHYVDISQNPDRKAFTNAAGSNPCICTSTRMYSFYREGLLLPIELMYLQGHRRGLRIPEDVRPSAVQALAGEGMSLPCLGTIFWALHVAGCF